MQTRVLSRPCVFLKGVTKAVRGIKCHIGCDVHCWSEAPRAVRVYVVRQGQLLFSAFFKSLSHWSHSNLMRLDQFGVVKAVVLSHQVMISFCSNHFSLKPLSQQSHSSLTCPEEPRCVVYCISVLCVLFGSKDLSEGFVHLLS